MEKRTFIAATGNKNKIKEFARILEPLNIEIVTAADLGRQAPEPEETGTTFEENAIIKAVEFAKVFGMPAIADDSGICVDALDGAPGVFSARYSGGDDDDNNALLMKSLEGVPYEKRGAHYACAICCAQPNGEYFTVYGECHGKIGFEYRGQNGFGYDPIFYIETGESFAEVSGERKDSMSHRGKALRLLADKLSEDMK